MNVAIAGAGNVGVFLAEDLARSGHEVLLIERSPEIDVLLDFIASSERGLVKG